MYTAKNNYVIAETRPSDEMLLDVGCGTGSNAREIKQRFPRCQITGLNYDADELELASEYLTESLLVDLNNFSSELLIKQYDLIICSHILEHLIDPKVLLSVLKKHLKASGRIIVLVPNFGVWNARLKVLRGDFGYEESGLYDRTHLRFFTHLTLVDELWVDGLSVNQQLTHGHFPLPIFRKLMPRFLVDKLDSWALRVFPNLFASEIGVIFTKC